MDDALFSTSHTHHHAAAAAESAQKTHVTSVYGSGSQVGCRFSFIGTLRHGNTAENSVFNHQIIIS